MIYFHPDFCPKTHEEAFRLQEQTAYLHTHMELVKQAIDVLQGKYFYSTEKHILTDPIEKEMLARSYESIQLQIETAATLVDECIEYIALLRGEETLYSRHTDETIACRDKIKQLLETQGTALCVD